MRGVLVLVFMLMSRPVLAQSLPIDPATGAPFPDLTADCPMMIAAGQTQTVTGAVALDSPCLGIKGTLNVFPAAGATAKISTGTVICYPGGEINITADQPDRKVDWSFKNIAPDLATDPFQYGTGLLGFCRVRALGHVKTYITRTASAVTSGSTVTLQAGPDGWGHDEIVLPDSREAPEDAPYAPESFTIAGRSGAVVTLNRQVGHPYPSVRNADGSAREFPHVGNLTRTIVFRSEAPLGTRGHVLFSGQTDVVLRAAAFVDMGRTTLQVGSQIGRYALHVHHVIGPFHAEGLVVQRAKKWGITLHHVNGKTIRDSIVYDAEGAGIMTEDSSETDNLIGWNLVVFVKGTVGTADGLRGAGPDCYWLEGPSNHLIGNAAYNCHRGFIGFGTNAGQFRPLGKFEDNTAWGNQISLEFWDLLEPSTVLRFKDYHSTKRGLFNYATADLTYTDFVSRGDPATTHGAHYLHSNDFGDYQQTRLTFIRPDVQNKYYGIRAPYGIAAGRSPFWDPTTTQLMRIVDGNFCNNVVDVAWLQPPGSLSYGRENPAFETVLTNSRHCAQSQTHVSFTGTLEPNQMRPVTVLVENYQGDTADDFSVYRSASAPSDATIRAKMADVVSATILPPPTQGAAITLNSSDRQQVWHGWEAAVLMSVEDYQGISASQWSAVLDMAVNELSVNRVRLSIKSGVEGPGVGEDIVNDNGDPNVINQAGFVWTKFDTEIDTIVGPWRQKVLAAGMTPWVGLQYVDFDASSFEHWSNPQEYAEFMVAVFQHMQAKYGWTPNAIDVINEPNNSSGWDASRIAAVIPATAQRLQAAGFKVPEFITPSTVSVDTLAPWADQVMAGLGSSGSLVTEFPYHRYSGATTATLQAVASKGAQYSKRTSMLEYWTPDLTYRHLHQDLTLAKVSAWQQGVFTDIYACQSSHLIRLVNGVPELCSTTKGLRQYMKVIRPGAQRIGASSSSGVFEAVAFINTDGRYAVVVKAEGGSGSFSVGGLPAGTYSLSWTEHGGTQTTTTLPDVTIAAGQPLATALPSEGALTIVTKSGPPPTPDTEAPTTTITVPDGTLTGTVTIGATCLDNVGCVAVTLQVDGADVSGEDTSAPYTFSLNTLSLANGSHVFRVVGRDAAGNNGPSTEDTRTVDNVPTPPADFDGDGVPDAEDKCPAQPGPKENAGCPIDQQNPCAADPLRVTRIAWPSQNTGRRSLTFDVGDKRWVKFDFEWADPDGDGAFGVLTVTDTRGCSVTVVR